MLIIEVTYVDRNVGPQIKTMLTFEADDVQHAYQLRRKFAENKLGRIWNSCYYYKEEYDAWRIGGPMAVAHSMEVPC